MDVKGTLSYSAEYAKPLARLLKPQELGHVLTRPSKEEKKKEEKKTPVDLSRSPGFRPNTERVWSASSAAEVATRSTNFPGSDSHRSRITEPCYPYRGERRT